MWYLIHAFILDITILNAGWPFERICYRVLYKCLFTLTSLFFDYAFHLSYFAVTKILNYIYLIKKKFKCISLLNFPSVFASVAASTKTHCCEIHGEKKKKKKGIYHRQIVAGLLNSLPEFSVNNPCWQSGSVRSQCKHC